ncbi:unnamed protein product [Closterium sp. NIES-53]
MRNGGAWAQDSMRGAGENAGHRREEQADRRRIVSDPGRACEAWRACVQRACVQRARKPEKKRRCEEGRALEGGGVQRTSSGERRGGGVGAQSGCAESGTLSASRRETAAAASAPAVRMNVCTSPAPSPAAASATAAPAPRRRAGERRRMRDDAAEGRNEGHWVGVEAGKGWRSSMGGEADGKESERRRRWHAVGGGAGVRLRC